MQVLCVILIEEVLPIYLHAFDRSLSMRKEGHFRVAEEEEVGRAIHVSIAVFVGRARAPEALPVPIEAREGESAEPSRLGRILSRSGLEFIPISCGQEQKGVATEAGGDATGDATTGRGRDLGHALW